MLGYSSDASPAKCNPLWGYINSVCLAKHCNTINPNKLARVKKKIGEISYLKV